MGWLSGWSNRQKITIPSSQWGLSADLTNEPTKIHIDSSKTDFWNLVQSSGNDVRFTASDGSTLLDYEIESFDNVNKDAWYHVKVPTVYAQADTYIYCYFGNPSAASGQHKAATWNNNYDAVYHLNKDKAGSFTDDSSGNGRNLSNFYGTTDTAGQIDRARGFDGLSYYLETSSWGKPPFGVGSSVEAWFNVNDLSSDRVIVCEFRKYLVKVYSNGNLQLLIRNSADNAWFSVTASGVVSVNNTYHVVAIWPSTTSPLELYVNGVKYTGQTATSINTGIKAFAIGRFNSSSPSQYFSGWIDEVTIATGKNGDWAKFRYHSAITSYVWGQLEYPTISVIDAGAGSDSIILPTKTATVLDAGSGSDIASVASKLFSVADTGHGTDAAVLTSVIRAILDSGHGSDIAKNVGTLVQVQDTGVGVESPVLAASLIVTDAGAGTDAVTSIQPAIYAHYVKGFPSGQLANIRYQITDLAGNVIVNWTNNGVVEIPAANNKSTYLFKYQYLEEGVVNWEIPNTNYWAVEVFDIYTTRLDDRVSTRLAASAYTAPDNTGIAAIKAKTDNLPATPADETSVQARPTLADIEASSVLAKQAQLDFIVKWILNKLEENPPGTFTLYDDDGVTVLKRWVWDPNTRIRSKAV